MLSPPLAVPVPLMSTLKLLENDMPPFELVASMKLLIKSATFYKYKGTYYIYGVLWDLQTN